MTTRIPTDPVKRPSRHSVGGPPGAASPPERSGQVAALRDLFDDCRRGDSRVVIVKGPVGCGKTELLNVFSSYVTVSGGSFLQAATSRAEQAVPFGVLAHLFHNAPIEAGLRARIARLVEEGQSVPMPHLLADSPAEHVAPQIFHRMCMTLMDVVERSVGPLVLAIDDVQYADLPSLRCLSFVVRRMRSAQLMVLLNESPHVRWHAALSEAELPSEPLAGVLRLPLFSPQGVEDVLAEQLGRVQGRELAAEAYAVSGGNPLLLRGFIEDNHRIVGPRVPRLGAATGFGRSLISCLYRYEPEVLQVASALAVLNEALPIPLLAQLAETDTETTTQVLEILRESGIVSDGLLRHPQAQAAVLGALTAEERSELQLRAANVQLKGGFSAIEVAGQIVAADRIESDCAVPVLHEAAEQALAQGEVEFATDCLRLSLRHDTDARRTATTTAMLVRALWRTEPYVAYRRVPALVAQAKARLLPVEQVSVPVDALLWFGRPAEAAVLIEDWGDGAPTSQGQGALHLEAMRSWLNVLYPDWAVGPLTPSGGDSAGNGGAGRSVLPPEPEIRSRRRAAMRLGDLLSEGPGPSAVKEAVHALRRHPLDEGTVQELLVSLQVLIHAEQFQEARQRTAELLDQARQQSAVVWEALLTAVGAQITLREGEPQAAVREIRRALELLPARNWGVLLGLPLGIALHASALTGGNEAWIDEAMKAAPRSLFETPFGLGLLRARGRRYLSGHPAAALDDFLAVGELADRWGMGHPTVFPWRSDAAQAYLHLGDQQKAAALAAEQLRRCGSDFPRVQAETLRVLAACSPAGERLKLLARAAALLQQCGAPLELALVLHDLGWALQEQGQYSKGRLMLRRGRLMAEERGARLPASVLGVSRTDEARSVPSSADRSDQPERGVEALSDAETRVVQLAVSGHSNRQIASRLFVTVSTVEQHLTRVYRKLNIKRRTDLAVAIQHVGRAESARTAC
ncbi:AAA family ATPase [Streptomyces sp. NPDC020898]|uniref:helix-turn-helix transcriptional regulator n=1 Tax=Streptomyces sp. NPDC020898 TaxID=3365101 RepID=UPI0037B31234